MALKNYILLMTVAVATIIESHSQDLDEDLFLQPDTYPSPLIGTDSLVKFLEDGISNGDAIG
jgi:hypothetical protein